MDFQTEIKRFCRELDENEIQYCVVEWRENEKILELFVHPESNLLLQTLLTSKGYEKIKSLTDEYTFIYRLIPDSFWKIENELFIHIACQMSCVSLSNLSKCMLPLDNRIQKSIWDNKYWDEDNKVWRLSEEDYLVFLVTKAVFNIKEFDNEMIQRIKACRVDYESNFLEYKLEGVFFRFTHRLIGYLKEGAYNKIVNAYRSFCDY